MSSCGDKHLPATLLCAPCGARRGRSHRRRRRRMGRVEDHVWAASHLGEPPVDFGDLGRLRLLTSTAASDQVAYTPVAIGTVEHNSKHDEFLSACPPSAECGWTLRRPPREASAVDTPIGRRLHTTLCFRPLLLSCPSDANGAGRIRHGPRGHLPTGQRQNCRQGSWPRR
jgi:hypothetical protein